MKKISLAFILILIFSFSAQAQDQEFLDVYEEHLNNDAIEYLQENNVIQGYGDNTYKPENRINRAEFTKIIVEAQFDEDEINNCISENTKSYYTYAFFKDVPVNEWYAKYVCMAKVNGIISGYPDGTYKPANYINFAEASKVITNALNITEGEEKEGVWFSGFVDGLAKKKAIPATIHFFDKNISRGEMAEVIWRLKENKTDKVSQSYEEITEPFPAIQSCSALKEKFVEYQSRQYYPMGFEEMALDTAGAPVMRMTEVPTAAEASEDFSTTNVQVSGVDEADIIKNDGEFIYMVKNDTVKIIKAYPPDKMEAISELDFESDDFSPNELFINENQLVVIGRVSDYYSGQLGRVAIYPPYPRYGSKVRVYIYDITNRADPKEERVVTFDGNYNTSRRINNNLYLVLNDHPDFWIMEDVENGDELIPRFQDGDKDPELMKGCTDIHYFPGHAIPRYLIVASIPLDDADGEIDREVFLGSSENVYSSRTHLYVASSETNFDFYTDWDWRNDRTHTLVFKFALEDGQIDYKARGRVPGRILNQFSMDAFIDHFRIATTIGNEFDQVNPSTSNVFVLDRDMNTVGEITGIAPGERIFSTRFLGDRLYMVTFKKVDPLFVISLKDPENPKILGKLKIPGFSDYLHPYDQNHIIGFGKETVEAMKGDFAWYQGMKIALFDVSDVENPQQKFVEIIGDRGTDSELLSNHKALLFDKDKELLSFPIKLAEIDESLKTGGDEGSIRGDTTFQGAYVYNLNLADGFDLRGRITHFDEEDLLKLGDWWPSRHEKNIDRIIYIGEYLYTISSGIVKASDMQTTEEVNAVGIE